jgi:hypothetical protein
MDVLMLGSSSWVPVHSFQIEDWASKLSANRVILKSIREGSFLVEESID